MMVSEEKVGIRRFVKGQLRDEPDLSTLTLGILKKRYLAHAGCESLSSEARKFMKQVVEEELLKMQKNDDSESEPETEKPQKKRKREKEELESEDETESTAKKTRSRQSGSSSDSEDEQKCKTGSQSKEQIRSQSKNKEAAEEEEESDNEKSKKPERHVTDDDLSDEEMNGSEKSGNESPSPEERVKKKASTAKNGEIRRGGKKTPRSDKESESDADGKSEKSDKISDGDSSPSEKEENVKKMKDSDSSSLCSLEEEEKKGSPEKAKDEKKKNKTKKKDEKNRGPKDEDKAVVRLKRYIALCGVRRNYKKLLDGCRSTRSKVAVLKKELEDLGVRGNPSIEKCKKIRLKREEAQELADLDVDNIITTEGRPKRRGTSAMQVHQDAPSSYQRTLNSDSDSDQENDAHKGRRKMSEWTNLHGIISDDADTD